MSRSNATLDAALAVNRFGLGARPGDIEAAAADPQAYLLSQIRAEGADQPQGPLPDSRTAVTLLKEERAKAQALKREAAAGEMRAESAPPAVSGPAAGAMAGLASSSETADSAEALKQARAAARAPLRELALAEILARTQLGAGTPAGFRERWALFWANHFTVSTRKFSTVTLAGPFEREAIRPHVFGSFQDLLLASSTHPGMLLYLDQAASVGPDSIAGMRRDRGLNENLAREILELHTVGADAGYTQSDVTEFARALTGWSVGREGEGRAGGFLYRPQIHEPGARTVMGRRYPDEGAAQGGRILVDLARHPKTARRLSRKLAAHFVADDPPEALVARLDAVWMQTGGDLAQVAAALVKAPEAWAPEQRKFKSPNDFVVSSFRAAGVTPQRPEEAVRPLSELGQRPFAAPQPNGWSETAADWAAGSALMRRLAFASDFAGRTAPQRPPVETAALVLGSLTSEPLRLALSRAETAQGGFALLLMSPEFQRR